MKQENNKKLNEFKQHKSIIEEALLDYAEWFKEDEECKDKLKEINEAFNWVVEQ